MIRIFRAHYSVVPVIVPRGLRAQTFFFPDLRSHVGDRKIQWGSVTFFRL
jgi:hypothetical protein